MQWLQTRQVTAVLERLNMQNGKRQAFIFVQVRSKSDGIAAGVAECEVLLAEGR